MIFLSSRSPLVWAAVVRGRVVDLGLGGGRQSGCEVL